MGEWNGRQDKVKKWAVCEIRRFWYNDVGRPFGEVNRVRTCCVYLKDVR